MSKKQNTLTGQATEEQIQEWKQKYPDGIFALTSGDDIAYFKNPNRHEINDAYSQSEEDKVTDVYECLGRLIKIGGSDAVLSRESKFLGAMRKLKEKMAGETAELVNL
jgi:hypothetical protein